MNNEIQKNSVTNIRRAPSGQDSRLQNTQNKGAHPAWIDFIQYCTELDHGEIELLKIQNGLPVLAEITRKKVKFG